MNQQITPMHIQGWLIYGVMLFVFFIIAYLIALIICEIVERIWKDE